MRGAAGGQTNRWDRRCGAKCDRRFGEVCAVCEAQNDLDENALRS